MTKCGHVLPRLLMLVAFLLLTSDLLLAQSKHHYTSTLRKANKLFSEGEFKKARIAYKQVLVFNDTSIVALKGLGKIATAKDKWQESRRLFEKALRFHPGDAEVQQYLTTKSLVWQTVAQGDSLVNKSNFKEAKKLYKEALDLDDEYSPAYRGLGKIAGERSDWKKSAKYFEQAVKADSGDVAARDELNKNPIFLQLSHKADSLAKLDEYKQAEKYYKKALKINKYAFSIYRWFGRRAFDLRKWGDARGWFKKIKKLQPNDLEANYVLGIAHRETAKVKALLLRKTGFNASRNAFDTVMQIDSTYKDVLYQRALLERLKKKWHESLRWAHRQLRLKPNHPVANAGLLKLYKLFLVHKSDKNIEQWFKNNPGEWQTLMLAEHHRRKDNFTEAAKLLNFLLDQQTGLSKQPVHLSFIRFYLQQRNIEKVNIHFRAVIDSIDSDAAAEFFFEDTKYIFTDEELAAFKKLSNFETKREFFKQFWARRNPMPTAPINVRAIEHFRRLLYSEKNFWFDGIRNWANNPDKSGALKFPKAYFLNQEFNDKGLMYIRHGEPDERAISPSAAKSNESWLYYGRSDRAEIIVHFLKDTYATGNNWRLAPYITDPIMIADRAGWDPKLAQLSLAKNQLEANSLINQLADQSREQVFVAMSSDRHTWEKDTKALYMPYTLTAFRGSNGKTKLVVHYALSIAELRSNPGNVIFEHSSGIYNQQWQEVDRSFEKVHLDDIENYRGLFLHSTEFDLVPETYKLSLFAKVKNSSQIGGWTLDTGVPIFDGNRFGLSDLLLAYEIKPSAEEAFYTRGDVTIIGNPGRVFRLIDPIVVYFEIYNLQKNDDGDTEFILETKMTQVKKKKGIFKKLFGGSGKKPSIALDETVTGNQATHIVYRSFDVSKLEQGEYELTVKVKDKNSGIELEKSVELKLVQ